MKKIVSLFLCVMLLVSLCSFAFADDKTTVHMSIFSGPEANYFKVAAEKFMEQNPDIIVSVDEVGRDGYFDRIKTLLFGLSDELDIVCFTNADMGLYAEGQVIESLTDYFNNDAVNPYGFKQDYFIEAAQYNCSYNGDMYAMPYSTSCEMLYYRSDLISEDQVPQTWDEYYELAKQFTKQYNPDSPTEYGTTIMGSAASMLPKEFSGVLQSFGGDLTAEGIVSDETLEALNFWCKIANDGLCPPDFSAYEYAQVQEALQTGLVAMAPQMDACAATLANPESSPLVAGKIVCTDLPGKEIDGNINRCAFAQNWAAAIASGSAHKAEAFQFLSFALLPDNFKAYMTPGMSTSLADVINSEEFMESYKYNYDAYSSSLVYAKPLPVGKNTSNFVSAFGSNISMALAGEISPNEALENIANEMNSWD